jgi:hypothetical protein
VLHLDVVLPPDKLVRLFFEGHHFGVFTADGISGPNVSRCDTVQGEAPGDNNIEHFQAVLPVAYPGNVLELALVNVEAVLALHRYAP